MLFEPKEVVLRDERTESDRRYLSAYLNRTGDLIFEGQDIGESVRTFWGHTEYEWAWTVKASDTPKVMLALDAKRNLMTEIKRRFSGLNAAGIEDFLKQNAIPYLFWSRVGD